MQAITTGDVYYLRSPFTSSVSQLHEKKVAYMLGTVSSRPAVVIRAPYHWDTYSTVTVLPSLTRGNPAIEYSIKDRYGYINDVDYKFVPHTPHNIPVGRLGRYIGRLSEKELQELLYAFKWIHDPYMQNDPKTYPIPECYREVFSEDIPMVDSECPVPITKITIDENMILRADQYNKTVLTTPLDIDIKHSISPEAVEALADKLEYHHDPSRIEFPDSIFKTEDLCKYAKEFDISKRFYKGSDNPLTKRDMSVLTEEELFSIYGSDYTSYEWDLVTETYEKMTAFDSILLGPRLPTIVLKKLLQFNSKEVYMLKKLCTILKNIKPDEYESRLKQLEEQKVSEKNVESSCALPQDDSIDKSPEAIKRYIMELRPYLSDSRIVVIPKELQEKFIAVPAYMIKQAYHGKKFKYFYMTALQKYEAAAKEKG